MSLSGPVLQTSAVGSHLEAIWQSRFEEQRLTIRLRSDLTIDEATLYLLYTACVMYDFFKFAVLLVCLPLASHSLSAQIVVPAPKQGVLQE